MGRLIAGMLIACCAVFAFAGPAGAAEIPPTAECLETAGKAIESYVNHGGLDGSTAQARKANDRLSEALAEADCISDAATLKKWAEPEPFSAQCVDASKAADAFFKPVSVQIRKLTKRHRADDRKLRGQIRKLGKRIRKLREAGASNKRIRAVDSKRLKLEYRSFKSTMRYHDDISKAVKPQAVATAVTTFELISLRCIGAKSYIAVMASGKKVDEPAARVLGTHRNAVNYSISQVFFGEPSVSAGVSDSRAAFAPGQDDRATLTFRRAADLALR